MDQSVEQMRKMIEEYGASLAKNSEMCKQTRPDLIAQVEEFYCMYQTLVDGFDHLTAELYKSTPLPPQLQMQATCSSESGFGLNSPLLTPDQKMNFNNTARRVSSVSSGTASSDLSAKEGSESISSSSDSESESFKSSGNAYFSRPMNTDRKGLHQKIFQLGAKLPSMEDMLQMDAEDCGVRALNVEENGDYEELLQRIIRSEEELRVTRVKLQFSVDETARLKSELEKSESLWVLAGSLQAQLESVLGDIKTRDADLEVERRRVLELERQISEGMNGLQGQLQLAQEETTMLKANLESESRQVLNLQQRIVWQKDELSDCDKEIGALKVVLLDAQENFSMEKACLQFDICSLLEKQNMVEARLREWELQGESLKNKLRQCEAEKMELKGLYGTLEIRLQGEISKLKSELGDRGGHVEVLNKNLDCLKLKYDMLMAEKDRMNAKVNTLFADVSSRDNQIRQMEEYQQKLLKEHMELITRSESVQKLVDDLKLRVVDLEREVDRQRIEISAGAEGKREAIRQLCFSLEHYRSGYKELRQAFLGNKRHAVIAL